MNSAFQISGFWKINNSGVEYGGDLYVNQGKGIILLEVHVSNDTVLKNHEVPYKVDFITGIMANGTKLTLLNCNRGKITSHLGVKQVLSYYSEFLVQGYCFDNIDELIFSQISFRLTNILEWGGISKYKIEFVKGYEFQLTSIPIEPKLLYSDDSIRISYAVYYGKLDLDERKEELVLKQEPYIIIESKLEKPIGFYIEKLIAIKRIIEMGTGNKADILEIKCKSSHVTYEIGDKIFPMELKVFHHYLLPDSYSELKSENFLFNMEELTLNSNLKEWFEIYSILEPIQELYLYNLYNNEMSMNTKFLNITQALETYHSRRVCNGCLKDYKRRVEKVLKNAQSITYENDRKLLLAGCKDKITLKARIYDLLLANYQIFFDTGNIEYSKFPQKISDTRNYLTHYDMGKKEKALNGRDLYYAYNILKTILEYYMMKELGFCDEFIEEKIKLKEKRIELMMFIW